MESCLNWTNIINELPEEGSIVFVRIGRKKTDILCRFRNDSFGLGDDDFQVSKWRYVVPPNSPGPKHPYYNPLSILQVEDRTFAYS